MNSIIILDENHRNIIIKLLHYCPVDLYVEETDSVWTGVKYETVEEREVFDEETKESFLTREVGASNIYGAYIYFCKYMWEEQKSNFNTKELAACFQTVLDNLEEQRIIREIPIIKRQSIKLVVDNT